MTSQSVGSSPVSGSVLTAQSLLGILSLPLSLLLPGSHVHMCSLNRLYKKLEFTKIKHSCVPKGATDRDLTGVFAEICIQNVQKLLQVSDKKTDEPGQTWTKNPSRYSSKEDSQTASKHMERRSLVLKEMPEATLMSCHFCPTRRLESEDRQEILARNLEDGRRPHRGCRA